MHYINHDISFLSCHCLWDFHPHAYNLLRITFDKTEDSYAGYKYEWAYRHDSGFHHLVDEKAHQPGWYFGVYKAKTVVVFGKFKCLPSSVTTFFHALSWNLTVPPPAITQHIPNLRTEKNQTMVYAMHLLR